MSLAIEAVQTHLSMNKVAEVYSNNDPRITLNDKVQKPVPKTSFSTGEEENIVKG